MRKFCLNAQFTATEPRFQTTRLFFLYLFRLFVGVERSFFARVWKFLGNFFSETAFFSARSGFSASSAFAKKDGQSF